MKCFYKKIVPFLVLITALSAVFSPFTANAATEDELRGKVVSVAQGEIGYTGTSSYSKYGDWYGYQGSWCTTFVLWCFNQAGKSYDVSLYSNIVPSGGNCNSMISWYSNKGLYHKRDSGYTPKRGDLVFFDWSGNGSSQHVGIVTGTSGSTVYTVEGNCSGKVKSREYTKNGSKPYNNISAIMGYASPNYSSVSSGSGGKTTKKQTTKKSTTKKATTKKATTQKQTTKATTSSQSTSNTTKASTAPTSTTQTTKVTTEKTTQQLPLSKLTLRAAAYSLQVGDSVKLEYSVEPSGANAVVGYFCDEEGIIEIGAQGEIKAIGEGTATVVVCANDELYSQKDFTVTKAKGDVTTQTPETTTRKIVGTTKINNSTTEMDIQNQLTSMGINISALAQNTQLYAIPIAIVSGTFIISIFILIVRKIKSYKKKKSDCREEELK